MSTSGPLDALKPYPATRTTGLPWLGDIPTHWGVTRAKNLFRCVDIRSSSGSEELLTVSSMRGVVPRRSATVTMFKAESYAGHKLCWPGDLVINSLWAWAGGLGVAHDHGIVSTAYSVYRPRAGVSIDSQFIHELVRSVPFQWELQVRSKGVWTSRLQLTDDSFLAAPFPLPPLADQAAIVHFLDHADRLIRRFIRAKQKLIKLLEEQKQAIIHRAVTRGLGPDVRLKPSGVEWLGDVPEHWEVMRVKQCAYRISKGTTPSTEGREILEAGPVRFIKAENVSGGRILDRPGCFIDEQTNAVLRRSQLRAHDILFVIAGATLGKVAVVESAHLPANTNQAVSFIRPKTTVNHGFLSLWLQSSRIRELTWLNAVQSAQPNLSMADLGNFVLPVPPVREQRQILDAVDMRLVPVDNGIDGAHREISLLREYRTRLIADVVTGKLDVREAAAKLPDGAKEPEELPPADEAVDDAADDLAEADELAEEVVA